MESAGELQSPMPVWSSAGFALGARLALPLVPGMVAFAFAIGTTAASKGFTLTESLLMNGVLYAGASQLVAMEIWPQQITFVSVVSLAVVIATVNARMLLISASLRPWLGPLPAWQVYPALHFLTDPGWLVVMRYRAAGGRDAAVVLGGGLLIWLVWMATSTLGYALGALVVDPRRYGLDLVMPIFFAAMLVPLWRGPRRAVAWACAGLVALAVEWLVPGWWFIIAGAVAGSVAEALIGER